MLIAILAIKRGQRRQSKRLVIVLAGAADSDAATALGPLSD